MAVRINGEHLRGFLSQKPIYTLCSFRLKVIANISVLPLSTLFVDRSCRSVLAAERNTENIVALNIHHKMIGNVSLQAQQTTSVDRHLGTLLVTIIDASYSICKSWQPESSHIDSMGSLEINTVSVSARSINMLQIGELFTLFLIVSCQNMVSAYTKWSLGRNFAFLCRRAERE